MCYFCQVARLGSTHFRTSDANAAWSYLPWEVTCRACFAVARAESVDQRSKPHPFVYTGHCAVCMSERHYTPRETRSWNGRW